MMQRCAFPIPTDIPPPPAASRPVRVAAYVLLLAIAIAAIWWVDRKASKVSERMERARQRASGVMAIRKSTAGLRPAPPAGQ